MSALTPDLGSVDLLARFQLAARRHGCRVRFVGASPELLELIAFLGLTDAIGS